MPRNWHAGPRFVILYFSQSLCFDFDCAFGSSLWLWHGDIVDIQKYQNAIAVDIEVVEQDRCAFFLHASFPVITLAAFHSFRIGEWISSVCGCCYCFCGGHTLTSCNMTRYRWSWRFSQYLAWFLGYCHKSLDSVILAAEAPAVGDAFCFCCWMLSSLILSAEAQAVGIFCFCCWMLDSLILSVEAPAVGIFCFCCQTLDSLILSVEAPAMGVFCFCCWTLGRQILLVEASSVGVFCVLIRSIMHVRCGSLTALCRLNVLSLERLHSSIYSSIYSSSSGSPNISVLISLLSCWHNMWAFLSLSKMTSVWAFTIWNSGSHILHSVFESWV